MLAATGLTLLVSLALGPVNSADGVWVLPTKTHATAPNWPAPPAAASASGETSFVRAAEASIHAVVHVQTASVVPDFSNPWLSMLGMASGRLAQGSGSGVVVESDGWIVTNHHVVDGAKEVLVNLSDGTSYPARIWGSDPSTDLAVLKIEPQRELDVLKYGDSDDVRVGEWVLAVGNPLNLTSTVTAGIVSAKGRNIQLLAPDAAREVYPVESFLQTDAAVNPGNSGGALVNLEGELIGINTAIASQTGSYAGYSFAIPSSIVAKVVRDLREFGRVQRAFLGIQVDSRSAGVRVAATNPGGGAEASGMKPGDRILAVDGVAVNGFPSLQEQLTKHRPGDDVAVRIERDGGAKDLTVTLTNVHGATDLEKPHEKTDQPAPQSAEIHPHSEGLKTLDWQSQWGVRLAELTEPQRSELRLRGGVVAAEVGAGEWRRQGLSKGFILLRVDGMPVATVEDVRRAVSRASAAGESGVLLEGIYPNGTRGFAGVSVPKALLQSRK